MTDREDIKTAVKEALQEEMKTFYVEREQHYQDHQFIKEFREWCTDTKSTVSKTLIKMLVIGILSLVVIGFVFWGREHIVK